jgi:hypothetical protein
VTRLLALFFAAVALFGQESALERLKRAMTAAQSENDKATKFGENGVARIGGVHPALRNWLESQLAPSLHSAADLEASLNKKLLVAGLAKSESADADLDLEDPGFNSVSLKLKSMPELPGMLFVTAGVKVPCGLDQAVYVYRFDSNGRARIIEDHPQSDWGYGDATLELSDPDLQGRRLLLIHRISVQCGSSWMMMKYSVYRINPAQPPQSLLSSEHSFWLDDEIFVLKPDELMIELLDTGIDTERRTNILRYTFADGVKRVEPMAFQPQDFADEWLTRPWSELQARSSPDTQKWHSTLHDEFVLGDHTNVVLCAAKPDRWSIGFQIRHLGEKELKEPLEVHLLVRDLGNYRFEMEAVSESEFEGCPGEGSPSDKHPWLSVEQLKALP